MLTHIDPVRICTLKPRPLLLQRHRKGIMAQTVGGRVRVRVGYTSARVAGVKVYYAVPPFPSPRINFPLSIISLHRPSLLFFFLHQHTQRRFLFSLWNLSHIPLATHPSLLAYFFFFAFFSLTLLFFSVSRCTLFFSASTLFPYVHSPFPTHLSFLLPSYCTLVTLTSIFPSTSHHLIFTLSLLPLSLSLSPLPGQQTCGSDSVGGDPSQANLSPCVDLISLAWDLVAGKFFLLLHLLFVFLYFPFFWCVFLWVVFV